MKKLHSSDFCQNGKPLQTAESLSTRAVRNGFCRMKRNETKRDMVFENRSRNETEQNIWVRKSYETKRNICYLQKSRNNMVYFGMLAPHMFEARNLDSLPILSCCLQLLRLACEVGKISDSNASKPAASCVISRLLCGLRWVTVSSHY